MRPDDLDRHIASFDGPSIDHLLAAIRAQNLELVKRLLPVAGIEGRNEQGETPLRAAVGSRSMTDFLIAQGADLTAGNNYGRPLQWFAAQGWRDLVNVCLDKGLDPYACGERFESAFLAAARQGHVDTLDLIVSRVKWDEVTKAEQLVAALAKCQSRSVAEMIVDLGIDPHSEMEGKETPIFTMARKGSSHACRQLVERGADVNHSANGYTPVYYAALYDKADTMLTLLDLGARLDNITPQGEDLASAVRSRQAVQQAYASRLARQAMAGALRAATLVAVGTNS
jgi:ankyrin repeat protein